MRVFAAIPGALLLLCALPESQASTAYDPALPPPNDAGPVAVSVRFQVLDFARVNARDESFDVTGYLETRWFDPRLAERRKSLKAALRHPKAGELWTPRLYFANALEQPRDHGEPDIEVDAAGKVSMGEIVSGKFSAELSLHSFPFDKQVLPIRIGAYYDRSQIELKSSPDAVGVSETAFLSDWDITGIHVYETSQQYTPNAEPNALVVIETAVARRWTFYFWRVLVPMTLLVMVSWTVLWMDPAIVAPQATTAMGTLISLVAFNFTIDFAMPKVGYLTFIDRHALLGLAFVAGIVVQIAASHHDLAGARSEIGRKIQQVSRWAFPMTYLIAVAIELVLLQASMGSQ